MGYTTISLSTPMVKPIVANFIKSTDDIGFLGTRSQDELDNSTPTGWKQPCRLLRRSERGGNSERSETRYQLIRVLTVPSDGVRKSATQTVSSDATTDDNSELVLTLAANREYIVDGVIFASSTSQVPDIKVAFTAPTGAIMDIAVIPSSGEPAELLQASGIDSDGIPLPANQPVAIHVTGTVKTSSNAGNSHSPVGSRSIQWHRSGSAARQLPSSDRFLAK